MQEFHRSNAFRYDSASITFRPLVPIVFIFIGNALPSYVIPALRMALDTSHSPITFITDAVQGKSMPRDINLIDFREFYNPAAFVGVRQGLTNSADFRSGFWLKTAERLFVLEQFMRVNKVNSLLHAELDQLFFGVDSLTRQLELSGLHGLFFPFHAPNRALASILFCNSSTSLSSLTNYFISIDSFENEMEVLARWANDNPSLAVALPTLATHFLGSRNVLGQESRVSCLSLYECGGAVDAAQLGQWVAGVDPRNLDFRVRPTNLFSDEPADFLLSRRELGKIRFEIQGQDLLFHSPDSIEVNRVYNLHIHSKIHKALYEGKPRISTLLESVNRGQEISIPGTRAIQLKYHLLLAWRRLTSHPLASIKGGFAMLKRSFRAT